jgi:DNA-binding Lrp family transcriptional regulator
MLTAFTMIQARPDAIKRVAQAIASLPHVSEVYSVTGEWDIIAIVRLQDYEKLAEVIPDEISQIDGITKTSTILRIPALLAQRPRACLECRHRISLLKKTAPCFITKQGAVFCE